MSLVYTENFLPAASVNQAYVDYLSVTGGIAPYSFALVAGAMPPGLTLNNQGLISGTATTLGLYPITVEASDSTPGTPLTVTLTFQFQVLDLINLLDSTVDQAQFVQQFEADLATSGIWSIGITSETSQTLIEFISAIGTFLTSRVTRAVEDAFPSTAQSDSAIRAVVNMQGLRLSRKLPATIPCTIVSATTQTLPPYSQLSGGGYNWFITKALSLSADVPVTTTLREGLVYTKDLAGTGTDFQTWVSVDDSFVVSDQDVLVELNGSDLTKVYGALWNYPGVGAYADTTLPDGRLNLQFGANGYGTVPGVNDVVTITYAKTQGSSVNGANLTGTKLSGSSVTGVSGNFTSNPSGGADEKPTVAYKNFAAGSFGTYSSAVTKSQYSATVANYPGIVDAITQAQREINPSLLKWMNVIRVSALTSSTWSEDQINEFLAYLQKVTMFQPKFLWQAPVGVGVDVDLTVYCYNSVNSLAAVQAQVIAGIQNLFAPRTGLLMTDLFPDDLTNTGHNSSPGQISYIVVNKPTGPMIVTSPLSPQLLYTVTSSGGSLVQGVYDYAVSTDAPSPSPFFMGLIDASTSTPPPWPTSTQTGQYWIISNAGTIGGIGGTSVGLGDQILATSPGSLAGNYVVNPAATNGVIDHGTPSNWVNPQVFTTGSQVALDWSSNPVPGALVYNIWGRRPGYIGILDTVLASTVSYNDVGGPDPTPVDIGSTSDTLIRYNFLNSLHVTVLYANRQTSALLPIRDAAA